MRLQIGANKVTCCPLGDGYEFAFQYDYGKAWKHLVETFGEAGAYKPKIPLFIEYKPSETRGRCFVDTAAKALCLLNDMQVKEMGVTLDFGHSTYGNENPAEALVHLAESPFKYYVHINDNDGRWDWDYFCGTKHFLEYVEFLYYLKKYRYNDYLTSDTSPTRWDIKGTFEANSRMSNKIWQKLDEIRRRQDRQAHGQRRLPGDLEIHRTPDLRFEVREENRLASSQKPMTIPELKNMAAAVRCDIIEMITTANAGHPGGSLSAADIVTALYFRVMRIDPKNPRLAGP